MKGFIVGLAAGAALALPVAAQAGETDTKDRDDWKPDYLCWHLDDRRVNCRVDVNTEVDDLVRFREKIFIDGQSFGTFTVWPQRMERTETKEN